MSEPWNLPTLVTTRGGVVHLADCRRLRPVHLRQPWDSSQIVPGVTRACRTCLPGGIPS